MGALEQRLIMGQMVTCKFKYLAEELINLSSSILLNN